ncbi:hypothetical protein GCM10009743_45600 [Kribbella swartbergensis]
MRDHDYVQAPIAGDDLVEVELRRSGFVDWNYDLGNGHAVDLLVAPTLWLVNWLTHLTVFGGGWTLRVWRAGADGRPISKTTYRRKALALADVHRRMHLARATLDSSNGDR